ncbi:MAG: DUF86 domain-containing protein [Chloroflexi bacterium]|nr:DUF86 domain-containing protein [Chloroflexota bacterium]
MRRDAAWLWDMVQAGRQALAHLQGVERDTFFRSRLHQDAVIRQLSIVGEAAKNVSQALRDAHPEVPWRTIGRFRDRMVHHYWRVDLETVWSIATVEVPAMIASIEPIIPPEDE